MRNFIILIICPILVFSFHSPFDRKMSLPYGRQLRAILSGKIPEMSLSDEPEDLQWWQSLSRNNSIDCKCGTWKNSKENTDRWEDEGIESLNHYPWSVSLVAPNTVYSFCSGSLINDRYVLTAASCVDGSVSDGVEVLIGTWPKAHFVKDDKADPDELNDKFLERKKVHRVIIHPKYSYQHLDYNIALLRLFGPVNNYGNKGGISPLCLPEQDDLFDGFNSSSLLWRFHAEDGYIIPLKRTEVDSVILGKDDCKSYNYSKEWAIMPDTMICAKTEVPEKSHPYYDTFDCPGDSGSPLIATKGDRKVQVGIDSWSACYGRPKGISVYTRVTEFLPWIKLHISEDGRNCAH